MSDNGNRGTLVRDRLWFDDGFTMVPNTWLRDKRLSMGARGLLGLLLSHDPGFEVSILSLSAGSPHGVDALRTLVGEVERAGYLKRYRRRERGRITGTVWHLNDPHAPVENNGAVQLDLEPVSMKSEEKPRSEPEGDSPGVAHPGVANPGVANPTTKEDHLEEHSYSPSRDQATDRAQAREESEAQSARPSGDVFDIATSAQRAVDAARVTYCAGRRGMQPHHFETSGYCRDCGTRRPDEGDASPVVVNPETVEVA